MEHQYNRSESSEFDNLLPRNLTESNHISNGQMGGFSLPNWIPLEGDYMSKTNKIQKSFPSPVGMVTSGNSTMTRQYNNGIQCDHRQSSPERQQQRHQPPQHQRPSHMPEKKQDLNDTENRIVFFQPINTQIIPTMASGKLLSQVPTSEPPSPQKNRQRQISPQRSPQRSPQGGRSKSSQSRERAERDRIDAELYRREARDRQEAEKRRQEQTTAQIHSTEVINTVHEEDHAQYAIDYQNCVILLYISCTHLPLPKDGTDLNPVAVVYKKDANDMEGFHYISQTEVAHKTRAPTFHQPIALNYSHDSKPTLSLCMFNQRGDNEVHTNDSMLCIASVDVNHLVDHARQSPDGMGVSTRIEMRDPITKQPCNTYCIVYIIFEPNMHKNHAMGATLKHIIQSKIPLQIPTHEILQEVDIINQLRAKQHHQPREKQKEIDAITKNMLTIQEPHVQRSSQSSGQTQPTRTVTTTTTSLVQPQVFSSGNGPINSEIHVQHEREQDAVRLSHVQLPQQYVSRPATQATANPGLRVNTNTNQQQHQYSPIHTVVEENTNVNNASQQQHQHQQAAIHNFKVLQQVGNTFASVNSKKMTLEAGTKIIYFIRHGESTFNANMHKQSTWWKASCCVDPLFLDAPLSSPRGEEQVSNLREYLNTQEWPHAAQLLITSPLTRALQTCILAFADYKKLSSSITVSGLCREVRHNLCDVGRHPDDIQLDFPQLDFRALDDVWWHHVSNYEPDKVFEERVQMFRQYLWSLQQKVIVVVGHSAFIKKFVGANEKLPNCGVLQYTLRGPHARSPRDAKTVQHDFVVVYRGDDIVSRSRGQ